MKHIKHSETKQFVTPTCVITEYPFGDVYGVGDLTKEITLSPGVEHALAHQYGQEASKYQADLRIGSIRLELEAMQQE